MSVVATCPLCAHEYPFDFPIVGKTRNEWKILKASKVNFVASCPQCKGRFRADLNEFLDWQD